ncbi:MAG TPA: glycosyltransferase family 4 protein [Usitatibacter sp.]|nr:glycosyltransferase family 4 protein [Usitatibacter sp.]
MTTAALVAVLPALVAAIVIALLHRSRWAGLLADRPNERSLHTRPTPRLGGPGLLVASLPFVAASALPAAVPIVACAVFLAVISLLDDARPLPVQVRLPAHTVAAMIAVLSIGAAPLGDWGWAAAAVLTLGCVWMTNLFNFMDGSDGLAGGMAAIGFTAFAIAAFRGGFTALALASLALASGSLGFLWHNFPPARVFLGDSGSIPLGFLAYGLGLQGLAMGAWAAWFPVLVFSPFIVDATVTLLRRLFARRPLASAHRDHAYQRLVLSGWSRRRLASCAYVLIALAATSALVANEAGAQVRSAIILAWLAIYPAMLFAIERRMAGPRRAA